jgi:hypothetical protein
LYTHTKTRKFHSHDATDVGFKFKQIPGGSSVKLAITHGSLANENDCGRSVPNTHFLSPHSVHPARRRLLRCQLFFFLFQMTEKERER